MRRKERGAIGAGLRSPARRPVKSFYTGRCAIGGPARRRSPGVPPSRWCWPGLSAI